MFIDFPVVLQRTLTQLPITFMMNKSEIIYMDKLIILTNKYEFEKEEFYESICEKS